MTQYAQPTVKVEELRLPGLDGMLPGADVKGREKVALEYLVEVGNQVVNEYTPEIEDPSDSRCGNLNELYNRIYNRLDNELLNDVDFKQSEMEEYIFLKADNKHTEEEAIILGLYTGCLLHMLTVRNRKKGERTKVHLNGESRFFEHLFYYAKQVDELVVEDFKGWYVCANIASYGGKANLVALVDCGNDSVGEGIGFAGEIDRLVVVCCEGVFNSHGVGSGGKIGSAILLGNYGDDDGTVGQRIASKGEAGLLMAVGGVYRESVFSMAGSDADVNLIIAACSDYSGTCNPKDVGLIYIEDIVSKHHAALGYAEYSGNINTIVISNCKANSIAERVGKEGNVKKVVSHNNECKEFAKEANIENIVEGEAAAQEFERIRQEYRIAEMLKLADTALYELSTEKILKLTKQIHEIYKSVEPKLKELMPKQEEK